MGGIVENASEKLIELKFGVFGSIGDVKFLPDKNIGKIFRHRISSVKKIAFYKTSRTPALVTVQQGRTRLQITLQHSPINTN